MPRGYSGNLLTAASALNASGAVGPNEVGGARDITITVTFGPGTTAGAVAIESGDVSGYGGTLALETTVNWAAATRKHVVAITGHRDFIQARVSTAIAGGTVDARITVAN